MNATQRQKVLNIALIVVGVLVAFGAVGSFERAIVHNTPTHTTPASLCQPYLCVER